VAAVGIAILLLRGGESRDPAAPPRLDVAGVSLLSLGLFAVVFALVQADEWGPGSGRTLGLLAGGAAILIAFWQLEGRVASPLVDFTLFRNGPYLGASAAAFALVGSYWAVMYFEPQYLQSALGYSAIAAGALILPITAPMAFFSPFSGFLIGRFGVRRTMTFGMLVGLAGLIALALGQGSGSYGGLLPGFLGFGISLALVYAPMSTAAMAAMPAEKVGIAAGVLAMDRVLAGALLLAITAAVFQAALPAGADPTASAQFGSAVADALWPAIAVVAVAALLTWLLVRDPDHPAPEGAHAHRHHRFHL
jgi:Major Facilitator Superfamily